MSSTDLEYEKYELLFKARVAPLFGKRANRGRPESDTWRKIAVVSQSSSAVPSTAHPAECSGGQLAAEQSQWSDRSSSGTLADSLNDHSNDFQIHRAEHNYHARRDTAFRIIVAERMIDDGQIDYSVMLMHAGLVTPDVMRPT